MNETQSWLFEKNEIKMTNLFRKKSQITLEMEMETLQLIPQIQKDLERGYCEQFYANKLDNL